MISCSHWGMFPRWVDEWLTPSAVNESAREFMAALEGWHINVSKRQKMFGDMMGNVFVRKMEAE